MQKVTQVPRVWAYLLARDFPNAKELDLYREAYVKWWQKKSSRLSRRQLT